MTLRTSCPNCGTVYATGLDDNDDPWRALCPCESATKCSKGKHPATHARYVNKKVTYWCNAHGVTEIAEPAPPVKEKKEKPKKEETKQGEAPTKEAPPKRERHTDPILDCRLPETIKFLYATHTYLVKCACGDIHRFCDRTPLPRFGGADDVPRMCCPKCSGGYPETPYQEVKK